VTTGKRIAAIAAAVVIGVIISIGGKHLLDLWMNGLTSTVVSHLFGSCVLVLLAWRWTRTTPRTAE
jgi:uncharacterized membrane protein YdcZ (DUF606 family)